MRAGALNKRVTLLQRSVSTNAEHEPIETFAELETVWAEVQDLRGRDFYAARQVVNELGTRFRIRWRSDLTTMDRISYDGRQFDIEQISEIGHRFGLEILAAGRRQ